MTVTTVSEARLRTPPAGAIRSPRRTPRRPMTPAEVLQGGQIVDEAMQRLKKTPPVFHRSKDIHQSRRCELRANLLPSILQPPSDSAYPSRPYTAGVDFEESTKAPDSVAENDKEFYRAYQQTLAKREEDEKQVKVFLEKDKMFPPPAWDPAQVAAENCHGLKDLVETKAANFRRQKETLVNTSSDLPFNHPQQAVDLQELTNILTLDLQLREMPWKGTNKSPGFVSLQLASRVPLKVRNTKHAGGVFETEPMPENDLHVLRMDLHVGEVRQIGYDMGSRFFKGCKLASRMAALVEPERSTLSGLVKMLRIKEAEAAGLADVLSDVLRDVAQPIQPPDLDAWVEARLSMTPGGSSPAERLEAMLAEPRRTLERLLDAANGVSTLAQELVPSLAKAIDHLALISVREVDRIASRSHEDIEVMLEKLATSEKERRELDLTMTRMAGTAAAGGRAGADLQTRNKILEADIRQQEKSYAEVLKEKTELEATMAENAKITAGLSEKVERLEGAVASLRKDRKDLVDCFSVLVEENPDSEKQDDPEERKADAARELAELLSTETEELEATATSPMSRLAQSSILAQPRHGSILAIARAGNVASAFTKRSTIVQARKGAQSKDPKKHSTPAPVLSFAVSAGVQTNTNFFFSDNLRLEDEMSHEQFDDVMVTAYRLYAMLCRYNWNAGANCYLLRPEEDLSEDSEGDLLPPRAQAPSSPRAGRQRTSNRLSRMQHLKSKVQKAQQQAANAQMEEEVRRLELLAKQGFNSWVETLCEDAGSKNKKATQPPFVKEDLLKVMLELVHGEGMRARIHKLEDHLAQLLPLADAKSTQQTSSSGPDVGFWKRVLRSVRHSMAARRGSTQLKAQAAHMMAINAATGSNKLKQLDSLPRLLGELAAIWASLPDKPTQDKHTGFQYRPFHLVLQEGVNGFYLKSHGRHKQVEQAVFSLCRAVLDHGSHPKVALFAVVSDILQHNTIGDRIPEMIREVEVDLGFRLQRQHLSNLPPDTAYCLCDFMRSLKGLARSKKFAGAPDGYDKTSSKEALAGLSRQSSQKGLSRQASQGKGLSSKDASGKRSSSKYASGEDQGDAMLSLQQVLAAGHASVASRSQVTATYFHTLLYAFAEIPKYAAQVSDGVAEADKSAQEVDPRVESPDERASVSSAGADSQGGVESGEAQNEALLISHLLAASSWRARQGDAETADKLWDAIVQSAASPEELQLEIRPYLRHSTSQAQFCASGMTPIAEVLVQNCGLPIPYHVVARALRSSGGSDEVTNSTLHWLVGYWRQRGGAGSILCSESHAYWAVLWALALERAREIELMGKLFELFDISQDGYLQFSEFTAFMDHISPKMFKEEVAQLFMLAADDTAAEMTKDAFISLSLRLNLSTDLDELEKLVALREAEMGI